jgi:hypothetical protein
MTALAHFFRIQPGYFTDDDYYRRLDQELAWWAAWHDESARYSDAGHSPLACGPGGNHSTG